MKQKTMAMIKTIWKTILKLKKTNDVCLFVILNTYFHSYFIVLYNLLLYSQQIL